MNKDRSAYVRVTGFMPALKNLPWKIYSNIKGQGTYSITESRICPDKNFTWLFLRM